MRKLFRLTRGPTGRTRVATALAAVGALVMSGGVVMLGASAATADPAVCVPTPAYTETINHPAVTHVVHHDAVTHLVHHEAVPATPDQWWNWSPNDTEGPQDYVPIFPTDERGTWQGPHENGGPDQDTYGTFNAANENSGRSSWFHREHGTAEVPAYDETVVDVPAYDETVVDVPAWTETINHPAVTCPDQPGTVVAPLDEQRMSCDMGVEQRNGTQTTTYVWNAETRTYEPVVGEEIWGEWVQVRDLTTAESLELECIAGEESLAPRPHKAVVPKATEKPAVVLGTEATVPTVVSAGLAGLPDSESTGGSLLAQLMVGGGLLLLLAGGWIGFGRRESGGHEL